MQVQRAEFVERAGEEGANVSALCREYGISRKTGYKWRRRYRPGKAESLEDLSRKPGSSPGRTEAGLEERVLALRAEHPSWGGRKLARRLSDRGVAGVPAPSTITAILKRYGRIPAEASRQRQAYVRFERSRPNELWQMDFKGHFALGDGSRCHALGVLDDHSRYCVGLRACADERGETVRRELTGIFRVYGLPEEMLMDNGSPWGNDAVHGYTPVVLWLIRLGIVVKHGRPRHPQTQGKLERLNLTLDVDLLDHQAEPYADQGKAQEGMDAYRPTYNEERPHEALGMEVPASRYRPSERSFPEELLAIEYEASDPVRRVQKHGWVCYRGREYRLPKAFAGYPVALRATEVDEEVAAYFCRQRVAVLNLKEGKAHPVRG